MTTIDPEFHTVSSESADHGTIEVNVAVVGDDDAPLILCVHGWPEIWSSWRHQMAYFAERGWRVAAMDVRGYGRSSRPEAIEAYSLRELSGDVSAVIDHLSPDSPVVLFGHDWGAPVVYTTARLDADRVRAFVGMSVPYLPPSEGNPMDLWDAIYPDRYFYMKYFQEPGVAEAAFAEDLPAAIRKTYYAGSGDTSNDLWLSDRPADTVFLDGMVDPDPLPAWMADDALAATIEAHAGGTHGAFNRYRAQYIDAELVGMGEPLLTQPSCFIGGEHDMVRSFVPGLDLFGDPGASLGDFRGTTIVDGSGHWVQQEKPDDVNAALDTFLASIGQ